LDANGRIILTGHFDVTENGSTVRENAVRLNDDGEFDSSFDALQYSNLNGNSTTQGNKLLFLEYDEGQNRIYRLNEDGTSDNSFVSTLIGSNQVLEMRTQTDNKILVRTTNNIYRLNEDGTVDAGFQILTNFAPVFSPRQMQLSSDGRITIAFGRSAPYGMRVVRLLPNGALDPSFTPYDYLDSIFNGYAVQQDGGVILGDFSISSPLNRFMRLLPNGAVDTSFNPGGTGFLSVSPGKIRAIAVLPDQKVLIAGDFQRVNNIDRNRIARLNADGTLDNSFQITIGGTGNYFTEILDIYRITVQNDGKLLVSGSIKYIVNGIQKFWVVRLNSNGSIDPTFNLGVYFPDYFGANSAGPNKPLQRPDGKILIGISSGNVDEATNVPLSLNADGSRDMSFTSNVFKGILGVNVYEIAIQPNGKIVLSGKHSTDSGTRGFMVRLNSDGSVDQSFQAYQDDNRSIFAFTLMQNGQILAVSQTDLQSSIFRLNANGGLDSSFVTGTGANGKLNAISTLPNGKILIGGAFTTYNGTPRRNFAVLDSNGNLGEGTADTNREVLCITVDGQGRVLVGGAFTSINSGGQQVNRSYVARLVELSSSLSRTLFDYDGDGRADLSVRRPTDNIWYILRGTAGFMAMQFGVAGDLIAPADYDGDAKTDIAVFRPSNGTWFIFNSQSQSFTTVGWGADGDLPVPADHDGDGKADLVVFRPSTNTWYTRFANGTFSTTVFGVAGDKPVVGDFDGDGKSDIAVWRPSDNNWYILKTGFGFFVQTWGQAGDIPVPADYDGDGKTDVAVFRPSTGQWFRIRSTAGFDTIGWGAAGDRPVPADYDGDGKAEIAVWRPSDGNWYIRRSSDNLLMVATFGMNGDKPAPADYDGDGKDDLAIFRPSTGVWYIWKSSDGQYIITQFGIAEDKTVSADYDGDGKADIAVWRPSNGAWYVLRSSDNGFVAVGWGMTGDFPVVGDYEGDGKYDFAVWRPTDNVWYIRKSSDNGASYFQWGISTDFPIPTAFVR
jgi:uncharacterized delta-60 repeat protein